jgi:glutathione S-transferase
MKLLGTAGSPYARKARVAFEEKKMPYEYVIARPSDPNSGVSNFNPLGKIPVLVCDDGRAIYDSSVIVEYVDGLVSTTRLIPDAFADRIEVKRWEALGDGIADATVAISHDERLPLPKQQSAEWYLKQQKKIDAGLVTMEKDLGSRQFCYGNTFTLADIACGMALGYLDHALPKVEWRKSCPALRALAERLAQRDSFRKTLPPPP